MHDCFFYFRKGGVVFYCAAYIIYYCITHIFFFSSTFVLYTLEELRGDCRMRSSASSSFFLFFVQWKMVRSDGQGEMKYYSLRVPQYKSAMEKKKKKRIDCHKSHCQIYYIYDSFLFQGPLLLGVLSWTLAVCPTPRNNIHINTISFFQQKGDGYKETLWKFFRQLLSSESEKRTIFSNRYDSFSYVSC